jgi:hypothetical protein
MNTTLSLLIGVDTSIEECLADDGAPDSADVRVEASSGEVAIYGPFENWAGHKVLAECATQDEAEALARKIAANPVVELTALGYSCADWLRAA